MILVAGSANLDYVVRAPHIPAPGETVLGHDFRTWPGGKGANQAAACRKAGGHTTHMLLALGHDAQALTIENSLSEAGVHLHRVLVTDAATGTAFICVDEHGENAITVAPGANSHLRAEHLPALDGYSHLMLQLEIPMDTVLAYARAAHAHGVKVVLNVAPAHPLPPELLQLVDILLVNEGELATLAGTQGSIAQQLQRLAVPCVVVTLGSRGCCAKVNGALSTQAAFPITPVDSTGAGDTFCGVLVARLAQGHAMGDALRHASAAGALKCLKPGAQSGIPTAVEVELFLARQPHTASEADAALRAYCGIA
ncbi:ribokinase [Rhodoferax sp. BAB1]|uniref:ribokinase n=1 Tax=Rhodoferax sp. BAB1 TaxID=2741720 RepID=UPI001576E302|nr:ribokinase [Rhodoferax sp. BAB1]QKO21845.1 ribokinase [Rhodoferax sp. BAB1]